MRACTSSKMSEEKSSPSCNKEELSKIKYKNVKFNYNVYKTNILLSYYSPSKAHRIHFWQTRQILYSYQQSSVVFKFCKPLLATLIIRGKKTESNNCRNELQQKQRTLKPTMQGEVCHKDLSLDQYYCSSSLTKNVCRQHSSY